MNIEGLESRMDSNQQAKAVLIAGARPPVRKSTSLVNRLRGPGKRLVASPLGEVVWLMGKESSKL